MYNMEKELIALHDLVSQLNTDMVAPSYSRLGSVVSAGVGCILPYLHSTRVITTFLYGLSSYIHSVTD